MYIAEWMQTPDCIGGPLERMTTGFAHELTPLSVEKYVELGAAGSPEP